MTNNAIGKMVRSIAPTLDLYTGITEDSLEKYRLSLGKPLPQQYLEFLRFSNGAEGTIGNTNYISIWPYEEIKSLNESYAVNEFAPGLLLFGSDGGDTAYAFDLRSKSMPIVAVPFIGMSLDSVNICADTFEDFLIDLASQ